MLSPRLRILDGHVATVQRQRTARAVAIVDAVKEELMPVAWRRRQIGDIELARDST